MADILRYALQMFSNYVLKRVTNGVSSQVYKWFPSLQKEEPEKIPETLFQTEIKSESYLFGGKYFAKYAIQTFNNEYCSEYFQFCSGIADEFAGCASSTQTSLEPHNELVKIYKEVYKTYKSPNKITSEESSTMSSIVDHLRILSTELRSRISHNRPNSNYLRNLLQSFNEFFLYLEKENNCSLPEKWSPISKLVRDLVNALIFIENKYKIKTTGYTQNLLKNMSVLNSYSAKAIKEDAKIKKDSSFVQPPEVFRPYIDTAIGLESDFNDLFSKIQKMDQHDGVSSMRTEYPLFVICNRYQALIHIIKTISGIRADINKDCDLLIKDTFLKNLTIAFENVFLSYCDLESPKTPYIKHLKNPHKFNPNTVEYTDDEFKCIKMYLFNPFIEDHMQSFLDADFNAAQNSYWAKSILEAYIGFYSRFSEGLEHPISIYQDLVRHAIGKPGSLFYKVETGTDAIRNHLTILEHLFNKKEKEIGLAVRAYKLKRKLHSVEGLVQSPDKYGLKDIARKNDGLGTLLEIYKKNNRPSFLSTHSLLIFKVLFVTFSIYDFIILVVMVRRKRIS